MGIGKQSPFIAKEAFERGFDFGIPGKDVIKDGRLVGTVDTGEILHGVKFDDIAQNCEPHPHLDIVSMAQCWPIVTGMLLNVCSGDSEWAWHRAASRRANFGDEVHAPMKLHAIGVAAKARFYFGVVTEEGGAPEGHVRAGVIVERLHRARECSRRQDIVGADDGEIVGPGPINAFVERRVTAKILGRRHVSIRGFVVARDRATATLSSVEALSMMRIRMSGMFWPRTLSTHPSRKRP